MKIFILMFTMLLSGIFFSGCTEGPAEKRGKKIDKVVENMQDSIQNKGPMQKVGEKIDDATTN